MKQFFDWIDTRRLELHEIEAITPAAYIEQLVPRFPSPTVCCHTFRATGITTYLLNDGGTLTHTRTIANHESPRTTKLCDRTRGELSLDEMEKMKI